MNSSNPVITIRKYTEADKNNWDYYVMQHSQSTIFHLTRWKKVIEKTFGHKSYYLIAVQAASSPPSFQASQLKVIGILPLFRIKSYFFGHYLISVPFAELGGPLADNEIIEQQLVEKAIELTRTRKCDYLELRNEHAISDLIKKSLYYNFKKEIFPDPDQNMQAIPRKARRMIRQGIKFGLLFGIRQSFFP